jgi:hypothetical protein
MPRFLTRAFGVIALIAATGVRAAAPDAGELQQEVAALRQMVLELQERVAHLEAGAPAPPDSIVQSAVAAVPAAAPDSSPAVVPAPAGSNGAHPGYISEEAVLKVNWSKVSKDMDQTAVIALLGSPSKVAKINGRTVWYYYYPGAGGGSVFFTDAGRVSSRQSPFGLGW